MAILIKQILDTSGLVTETVLNIKTNEVENKIHNNSQYIITQEFSKFTAEDFASKLKQANLVSKIDLDNKLTNLYKRITSSKTKTLEVQKKVNSLITKGYTFLGRICFKSNDGSQNTFFYQPTLDTLELNKNKGTDYVLSWKSKGVFNSKLKPLYTAFLCGINISEYRIGIKLDKKPLPVEQNNYLRNLVYVSIACDLDAWPRNPTNNFKF